MCGDAYGYLCDECFYKVTREGSEEICDECDKAAEAFFALEEL